MLAGCGSVSPMDDVYSRIGKGSATEAEAADAEPVECRTAKEAGECIGRFRFRNAEPQSVYRLSVRPAKGILWDISWTVLFPEPDRDQEAPAAQWEIWQRLQQIALSGMMRRECHNKHITCEPPTPALIRRAIVSHAGGDVVVQFQPHDFRRPPMQTRNGRSLPRPVQIELERLDRLDQDRVSGKSIVLGSLGSKRFHLAQELVGPADLIGLDGRIARDDDRAIQSRERDRAPVLYDGLPFAGQRDSTCPHDVESTQVTQHINAVGLLPSGQFNLKECQPLIAFSACDDGTSFDSLLREDQRLRTSVICTLE